jgi:DNA-binding transcriptional LysR family regulator
MDLLSAMSTFVRVIEAGSLSKAARALELSPAAVSRQITALEEELGAPLLVRTTRRIALTEEGARFYERAERTLSEAEEARASVRKDHALSGLLTVSVPTALGLSVFGASVPELVTKNPGLSIDLRLEDHPVDLVAEGVDVAIRAGLLLPDTTTLVAQRLGTMPRVVVASPAYLKRRGEPGEPSELVNHDAVVHLHAGGGVGVWTFRKGGRSVSVELSGHLRATALHPVRDAVLAGAGLALLPRFMVARDLEGKRLRALPLGGYEPETSLIFAVVRTESRGRARVRAFVDHARERIEALAAH